MGGPKARLNERQEALRAAGLDPKLAKNRKAKLQEQHVDDCGSDFGPLARDVGLEEAACYASTGPYVLGHVLWGDYASRASVGNGVQTRHARGIFGHEWYAY